MRVGIRMVGVLTLSCGVFLVGGCAGAPPTPSGAGAMIEGGEPATLVVDDMFPPNERVRRTASLDPKTHEVLGVETSTREMLDDDSWVVRSSGDDDDEKSAGEMIFRRQDDGSVALVSLIAATPKALARGQARYHFEPALVMTPARLDVGETFEHTSDVRIVSLEDESEVIQTGTALRRLELVGRQEFGTRGGEVETLRVRARFQMTLGATVVTNDSIVWVEPGGGALAESTRRVVKVFGVPVQEARSLEQEAASVGE
ncbi:MAG: hypothetical protein R3B57_00590 [Phycisphaerales bacterium]